MTRDHIVGFDFKHHSPFEAQATIQVSPELVNDVYQAAVALCAGKAQLPGVQPGMVSKSYAARHYHGAIMAYIHDFLISFCAGTFLRQQLRDKKLVIAGLPRCRSAEIGLQGPAVFAFDVTVIPIAINAHWKHAHFRAPVRKNYRDLDNQVMAFLHEEHAFEEPEAIHTVEQNDWIGFWATPLNGVKSLCPSTFLWLHIGSDDPDLEARMLFVGQKNDASFSSQASFLQEYFRAFHDKQYDFTLQIERHAPSKSFNIDSFKQYFKLKSDREVQRKMVEVFSFRHDISLRRETAEAALRVMLRYHPFHVPFPFVQQEAELLLENICSHPDYYVYKSSPDFREKVQLLAQKRVREAALMDALACDAGIVSSSDDILGYLNLLTRPRTKEFIYFQLPEMRVQERYQPLSHDTLVQICSREKTLNHVIQTLLRNSL